MFIPLTAKSFLARLEVVGSSEKWGAKAVGYLAKRPRYRKIEILKKASERSILVGGAEGAPKIRVLHEPCYKLKRIQEYILRMILEPALDMLRPSCHGCVPGRSTISNARPHVGARLKIHMDLKDFFPSISVRRVYGLFHGAFRYEARLSWLLANLCCFKDCLPQGAPTSPMIANFVATPMDWNLERLLSSMGGYYTRYVDDLTFSFRRWMPPAARNRLIGTVTEIAKRCGFTVNHEKTGVSTRKRRMSVTGIVVNDKVSVPREFRANLRAAIHHREAGDLIKDSPSVIEGRLAYINMVAPEQKRAVLGRAASK